MEEKTPPMQEPAASASSCGAVGLATEKYEAALAYLFDRVVPAPGEKEWYWNIDEPEFDATTLEWTRIQTVLFANAGRDLALYGDEQVGLGLNYLISPGVGDVCVAAADASVPLDDAVRMLEALPALWHDCVGPRLARPGRVGGEGGGALGFVCSMWFDVWPLHDTLGEVDSCRDALWRMFESMLAVPCRAVQLSALEGIYDACYLRHDGRVQDAIKNYMRGIDPLDEERRMFASRVRDLFAHDGDETWSYR